MIKPLCGALVAGLVGGCGDPDARPDARNVVVLPVDANIPWDDCLGSGGWSGPQTITVGGRDRSFTLRKPPGAGPCGAEVGLIIALHDGGSSAAEFEQITGLTAAADAANLAVVYPEGVAAPGGGPQSWNAGPCCGVAAADNVDDVDFIRTVIRYLQAGGDIDTGRALVTGHGDGGMLAYRLACQLSDRVGSIVASGSTMVTPACTPARPVGVLQLQSELDTVVPHLGGAGTGPSSIVFPAQQDTLARWAQLDACGAASSEPGTSGYAHTAWADCAFGSSLEYYLTADGGHAWPGAEPGGPGDPPSTVIDATALLIEFARRPR